MNVIDLFAGAGGFALGAHRLTDRVFSIELDADAVATQQAARMDVLKADLTELAPFNPWGEGHLHLHASPPCQSFSTAGKKKGRAHLDTLAQAVGDIFEFGEPQSDLGDIEPNTLLVLVPAYWIRSLRPDSVSLEQVRSVLPVWEAYATAMERFGYSAWAKILHSEQFGVPQTRTRAWLGARLDAPASPPTPTHSLYHTRNAERLDEGVLPWVSMAEALGWDDDDLAGFPRRADSDDTVIIDGVDYRARDFRRGDVPAFGLTEKARSWTHYSAAGITCPANPRITDAPAHTVTAAGNGYWTRGAEIVTRSGGATLAEQGATSSDARKITVAEAAVLQGFPSDHPFKGTKTSQFRQVGNAVNPAVAEAVLRSLTSTNQREEH